MAQHVEADIEVRRFAFASDDNGKRFTFPHAESHDVEGRAGGTAYGGAECVFEALEGRLDTLRWTAGAASIGKAWLRDDGGRVDLAAERVELPRGILLVRAEHGVEIIAPHVSFSELTMALKGPFTRAKPAKPVVPTSPTAPTPRPDTHRQERFRFFDSLAGKIDLTIKVVLDLPVLGKRSLDQKLEVPIKDGSLDYRSLEDGLDWLEGRFLDISAEGDKLAVRWKVPIFGSAHDLISWTLDKDATTLATFGRVPVRSLADYQLGDGKPDTSKPGDKKKSLLQAFSIDAIDIALSLLAPRSVEVGAGLIMFGGDDAPGLVDLEVKGAIKDRGAGALRGAIGSIDTTLKDVKIGPATVTVDRLNLDGIDQLEVTFDGFTPTGATAVIHRVTATNLALKIS